MISLCIQFRKIETKTGVRLSVAPIQLSRRQQLPARRGRRAQSPGPAAPSSGGPAPVDGTPGQRPMRAADNRLLPASGAHSAVRSGAYPF